jgi:hypothetical protein
VVVALRRSGLFLALAVTVMGLSGVASPADAGAAGMTSKAAGVRYTSKTIKVDRATVKKTLIGISRDGTFKFKSAGGALSKIKRGKVMLLSGSDALAVTKVTRRRGQLLVKTKPASLTDVISAGKITFSGVPDFRKAVLKNFGAPLKKGAASAFARPGYPYVGSRPGPPRASPAGAAFSAQGSVGVIGYSLTFKPVSATRLEFTGTICVFFGSICANGPANGLDVEITITGYLDVGDTTGGLSVSGGGVTNSSMSLKRFKAHARVTYTVKRGDGAQAPNPPAIRLPIGIDYTVPGAIPFYLKVQMALIVSFGVNKGTVEHGGVDVTTGGSGAITRDEKTTSTSGAGDAIDATILTQSNGGVPPSFAPVAGGSAITLQLPKVGIGLGFTAANGIAYIDNVIGVGQEVGSSVAGMFCSSYYSLISIGTGLEAQVGLGKLGLSFATPRQVLLEKKFYANDPGCPPIGPR